MPLTSYQRQVRKELLQIIANPHNEADNVTLEKAKFFFTFLTTCRLPVEKLFIHTMYPVNGLPFTSPTYLAEHEIDDNVPVNAVITTFFGGVHNVAWLIQHYNNNNKGLNGLVALYKMLFQDENLFSFGNFLLSKQFYFDALNNAVPKFTE